MDLREAFGEIDIYLFDQLLKGRIAPGMEILDAGCGSGRNLIYFLRQGFSIHAIDASAPAVERVRGLAAELAPGLPANRFRVAEVAALPFPAQHFDVVISNAVLHFARDEEHFGTMLDELARVLRPGGMFFARLASTIGIEERVVRLQGRWHRLPDGTDRFLVDEELLRSAAERFGGVPLEPLKTTVVDGRRAMTTWVLRREPG